MKIVEITDMHNNDLFTIPEKYYTYRFGDVMLVLGPLVFMMMLSWFIVTLSLPNHYEHEYVGEFISYNLNYSRVDEETKEVIYHCYSMTYRDENGVVQEYYTRDRNRILAEDIRASGLKNAYIRNYWYYSELWFEMGIGWALLYMISMMVIIGVREYGKDADDSGETYYGRLIRYFKMYWGYWREEIRIKRVTSERKKKKMATFSHFFG